MVCTFCMLMSSHVHHRATGSLPLCPDRWEEEVMGGLGWETEAGGRMLEGEKQNIKTGFMF